MEKINSNKKPLKIIKSCTSSFFPLSLSTAKTDTSTPSKKTYQYAVTPITTITISMSYATTSMTNLNDINKIEQLNKKIQFMRIKKGIRL